MVILFIYRYAHQLMELAVYVRSYTQLEVHFAVMHMLREDHPSRVLTCQMQVSLLALTRGWSVNSTERIIC